MVNPRTATCKRPIEVNKDLTATEVAYELGISEKALDLRINEKTWPPANIRVGKGGKFRRWSRACIDAWKDYRDNYGELNGADWLLDNPDLWGGNLVKVESTARKLRG